MPPKLSDDLRHLPEWCEQMAGSDEGLASLANVLHDCREHRLQMRDRARECLRRVSDAWHAADNGALPELVFKATAASYRCLGSEVPPGPRDCSRVMNVLDLRDHNLDLKALALPAKGHVHPRDVRRLEKRGVRDATRGAMANGRGFAWVTPSSGLSAFRARRDANGARDVLGLQHYDKDHHLVEVMYPPDALDGGRLRVPTFLEGCPSLIFRAKKCDDGWGRTVHLGDVKRDGLPEAVHEAIPFSGDFRLADFGRLTLPPPRVRWKEFLETLPHPWSPDSVVEVDERLRP